MKPESLANLEQIEIYPHQFTLPTVYSDMDAFRHINNGATGRYFEEARSQMNMLTFGEDCMSDPKDGLQLLFARVEIDFLAQINYPGTVQVATAISNTGTSSYTLQQAIFQNDKCCAQSKAIMVKARYGKPSPLTPSEQAVLQAHAFKKLV